MWQLIDIAYVIPATVGLGFVIGKYLESKSDGDFVTNGILIGAACGFVLTIYKIKNFVDSVNQKSNATIDNRERNSSRE